MKPPQTCPLEDPDHPPQGEEVAIWKGMQGVARSLCREDGQTGLQSIGPGQDGRMVGGGRCVADERKQEHARESQQGKREKEELQGSREQELVMGQLLERQGQCLELQVSEQELLVMEEEGTREELQHPWEGEEVEPADWYRGRTQAKLLEVRQEAGR